MIPQQLKKPEINFVLLEKNEKKPFEKDWQNKEIKFNNQQLISHIENGGNYGVIGGGEKNLIIVDFDSLEVQDKIVLKLPETFTVKSGSGKLHKYFYSDNAKSFKIFDQNKNTLVDIQGIGKQVVGAGSIHPNGNKYEVVNENEISFINYSELEALLKPFEKDWQNKEIKFNIPDKEKDNFTDKLKSTLPIEKLISHIGIDTSKNPTNCPFHDSKGGKCLGFQGEVAHCFHCSKSWNIFSLAKEYWKCDFKEALEKLSDIVGMSEELEDSRKKFKEDNKIEVKKIEENVKSVFSREGQAVEFFNRQQYFFDRSGSFWLWDKEKYKWIISDDVDILNLINKALGENVINSKIRTEILNALKQEGRKRIPKNIGNSWVQFKNKIFDIKTGKSFEATADYFVTNPIDWEISGNSETPTMDKLFEDWVGKEYVETLYEIISYCLLVNYPIHRLFCFIGSGMNGKSCFLRLIEKFIGKENGCSTELDNLFNSRFEITKLYKKLYCQMGETNFNEMKKPAILKRLTGQDMIGYEFKGKTPFDGVNYAKIIIATNNLPTTSDKTIGFYRRWLIIDFPNQFEETGYDPIRAIPESEFNNLATKTLITLKTLLERGKFANEGTIDDRIKSYEDKSNPLDKFLKEFTDEDFSQHIWKWEFEKKLNEWCSENHYRQISSAEIGKRMKEKGCEQSRISVDFSNEIGKNKQWRAWLGLKWK